jgi:hypothetical protein
MRRRAGAPDGARAAERDAVCGERIRHDAR